MLWPSMRPREQLPALRAGRQECFRSIMVRNGNNRNYSSTRETGIRVVIARNNSDSSDNSDNSDNSKNSNACNIVVDVGHRTPPYGPFALEIAV